MHIGGHHSVACLNLSLYRVLVPWQDIPHTQTERVFDFTLMYNVEIKNIDSTKSMSDIQICSK